MRNLLLAGTLLAFIPSGYAFDPAEALVEVEGDKWVFQQYALCEGTGETERIHYRGLAPKDGSVSRDVLVSLMATQISAHEQSRTGTVCKVFARRIRKVDLAYTVNLSAEGYQVLIEYKTNGTHIRENHSWED